MISVFHADGTVLISHGGVEMGQGLNTKVAQVAARTLGLPIDSIRFRPNDTMLAANATVSGGSSTSDGIGMAVLGACEMILERIKPVRDELPHLSWRDLIEECHSRNIDLTALYVFKIGESTPYPVHALSCSEVEIDVLTGNVQLTRVDILEDVGRSQSPLMDIGQIEGAFVMGIGYFFSEELRFDKTSGALLTNRTWNYTPPGPQDIPIDFRVTFLENSVNEDFVLKSKATGEPPLATSCSCLFALRNAIVAARRDAGITEWCHLRTPVTPEQVFLKSAHSYEEYRL